MGSNTINENDYVLIIAKEKKYFTKAEKGKVFNTKYGSIDLSSIIGKKWGTKIEEHIILAPGIEETILYGIERRTQIVYPKDGFYIIQKLNIFSGKKVFECGTGSGAFTIMLSYGVYPDGKIISFEKEKRFYEIAKKNIDKFGKKEVVEIYNKDIEEAKELWNEEYDALFIDLREPWEYIEIYYQILKSGGFIGFILPTANQVSRLLEALQKKFCNIEVCENLQRFYKIVPERFRPEDRMIGHTGYLIFARKGDGILLPAVYSG